jgi:hypothetical protein
MVKNVMSGLYNEQELFLNTTWTGNWKLEMLNLSTLCFTCYSYHY